jgi:hypothetical protein
VIERTAKRRPHRTFLRRPKSRRDWLITITVGGTLLALKLILGVGIAVTVIHLLTH